MRRLRLLAVTLPTIFLGMLAAPGSAAAQELFTEQPAAFGAQACNGGGCWTNYMLLVDVDNDGDLDVLFPNAKGFFSKDQPAQPFVMYKNGGNSTYVDASAELGGGYSGWLRQVAAVDVTGDGFVDIYAPSAWGDADKFFINDGTGKFTDEGPNRLPNLKSHAGATRFGDVDNDGDMDLLVGDHWTGLNGGTIAHLYLNDGTGHFAESAWQLPVTAQGDQPIDFDLFDMDGDLDLDLYIDMHSGSRASVWKNDGTGQFTDATAEAGIPNQKANGFRYGPVACDVDGDGDLDVWQDNAVNPGALEMLMINDGTGKFADETGARVTGNPASDDNGLACVDVDGDGDFDVAIMSLGTPERVLINDGTGHFTYLSGAFSNITVPTLWFDFGDMNGDGRLDAVTAQGEGSDQLERVFLGTMNVPVDTVAPKIRAVEAVGSPGSADKPVVRFAVSDNATTDTGPRLKKAYVKITAPAAAEVTATFMGGDLFRAVLPAQSDGAQVTFQACATDRQNNDGCSEPKTYTVTGMGTGGGGAGGSGTGGTAMGGAGTGGVTGGSGGAAGGAGGAGGSTGTGGFQIEDKGGCGCGIPGADPQTGTLAFGIAGLLGALARRRRRAARD